MMNEHEARRFWRNLALLSALWCTAGAVGIVLVVMVVMIIIQAMGW